MLKVLIPCGFVAALLASGPSPAGAESPDAHGGHGEAATFSAGSLVVENPWARESVTRTGAAYLVVRNEGDAADRLIGVAAEVADRAEVHSSVVEDGVMRMRAVGSIEVPAGGAAVLEPGGLHVMLIGLKAPLVEGESFGLTLSFENAGEAEVVATIEDVAHGGAAGHAHDHRN